MQFSLEGRTLIYWFQNIYLDMSRRSFDERLEPTEVHNHAVCTAVYVRHIVCVMPIFPLRHHAERYTNLFLFFLPS